MYMLYINGKCFAFFDSKKDEAPVCDVEINVNDVPQGMFQCLDALSKTISPMDLPLTLEGLAKQGLPEVRYNVMYVDPDTGKETLAQENLEEIDAIFKVNMHQQAGFHSYKVAVS